MKLVCMEQQEGGYCNMERAVGYSLYVKLDFVYFGLGYREGMEGSWMDSVELAAGQEAEEDMTEMGSGEELLLRSR